MNESAGSNYGHIYVTTPNNSDRRWLFQTDSSSDGDSVYVWSTTDANWRRSLGWRITPYNQWMHVAITYDGGTMRSYRNGSLMSTHNFTTTFAAFNSLYLGGWLAGLSSFNGILDDMVMFNTVEDVSAIMNRTHPAMLGWWTGGGAGNNWSELNNWGGAGMKAGRELIFSGSNKLTSNNNDFSGGTLFKGITFRSTAGAFTLNGNTINLTGDVVNDSAAEQTINLTSVVLDGADRAFNAAAGPIVVNNAINQSGTRGLVKSGAHELKILSACGYTGPTSIHAGTMRLGPSGTLGNTAVTVSGATAALAGVGSVGGLVSVENDGRLAPGADESTPGTLSLNGGLTLNATAQVSLNLGDPGTPGYSDLVSVTGDLTLNGISQVTVSPLAGFAYGTYDFVTYSGNLNGTGSIAPPENTESYGYQILTATANTIQLRVYQPPATKTWDGSQDGVWDIDTTENWLSDGSPATYREGVDGNDPVVFDDSASGTTDITLDVTVEPFTVTFNNGTKSYTVSGNGSIAGDTGLTLGGSGSVTLGIANTFSGDAVLNGGTLTLGHANALGGSTLNYNNQGGTLSFGALTAATLGGLKGAQGLSLSNASAQPVTLTVGVNDQVTTYSGTLSGGGGLTKAGGDLLSLSGANEYSGHTVVESGVLTAATLPNTAGVSVDGGTLNIQSYNAAATLAVALGAAANVSGTGISLGAVSNEGSVSFTGASGTITLAGLTGCGTTTFAAGASVSSLSAGTVNFNGATASVTTLGNANLNIASGTILTLEGGSQTSGGIAGGGTVRKTGGGVLTLNGSNTYTAGTEINGGTLSFGAVGNLPTAPGIYYNVGAGVLEYTGNASIGTYNLVPNVTGYVTVTDSTANLTVKRPNANYIEIVKQGPGQVTMQADANTDCGPWRVNGGTLLLNGPGSRADWYNNVQSIIDVVPGAVVKLANSLGGQIGYMNSFAMSGGTFDVNGQNPASGQWTSVPAINGSGYISNSSASAGTAVFQINSTPTFTGNMTDGVGTLSVTMAAGTGTWTLSGNNTHSGNTTVASGKIVGVVGGSCVNSHVNVTGGNLGVSINDNTKQWSCKSLALSNSRALTFGFTVSPARGAGAAAPLTVVENASFGTGITITVTVPGELQFGVYPLMRWATKSGAGAPPTVATMAGGMSGTLDLTIVVDGGTETLCLSIPAVTGSMFLLR